jgi:hypothetical protein
MNDEIRVMSGSQASCLTGPTCFQRVTALRVSTSKMLVGRDRLDACPPSL